jgi:hypothetical protein
MLKLQRSELLCFDTYGALQQCENMKNMKRKEAVFPPTIYVIFQQLPVEEKTIFFLFLSFLFGNILCHENDPDSDAS